MNSKVNVVTPLELEFTSFEAAVRRNRNDTTDIPLINCRNQEKYSYPYLPKPSVTDRMWQKDNFKMEYNTCVMVIVIGNGHGDTSSNPGRDCLHFT